MITIGTIVFINGYYRAFQFSLALVPLLVVLKVIFIRRPLQVQNIIFQMPFFEERIVYSNLQLFYRLLHVFNRLLGLENAIFRGENFKYT